MAHPLLTETLLLRQRVKLRKKGFSRSEINNVMDGITGDTIQHIADLNGISLATPFDEEGADPVPPAPVPPGPRPHPFMDWITTFLASPIGQALEAALTKWLLSLLGI